MRRWLSMAADQKGYHMKINEVISENFADAMATIHKADLGYCNFHAFKCAGTRSCTAWVTGGAIDDKDRTE